jgi:pyruvate dehydrogenase E2 component (dihydrolipoamide acetyltransferase)
MMNLSVSFDHRVIDGSVGAEFCYEVIKYLEKPELLFLELA